MRTVRITNRIEAPLESVWNIICDAERLPEWEPSIVGVHGVTGTLDRVGSRYTAEMSIAGKRLDTDWEVTRVEPHRLIERSGDLPFGGAATARETLLSVDGATEATLEFEYQPPGGIIGKLVDRGIQSSVPRSRDRLKELVEREVHRPASGPSS